MTLDVTRRALLALTAAQHDDLLGLAQALQPHGWRLHFATQQNG